MWPCFLIWLAVAKPILANAVTVCSAQSKCIPLSDCEEISKIALNDSFFSYVQGLFCGYFHEPYVCCNRNCETPNGNPGFVTLVDNCQHLKANAFSPEEKKRKFVVESLVNTTHVCCNKNEDSYMQVLVEPIEKPTTKPNPTSLSCTTPNGAPGKCTHISECPSFSSVVMDTDQRFQFLNDSFCGYWRESLVCCGGVSDYTEHLSDNLPDQCGVWDEDEGLPPWLVLIQQKERSCVGALINREYALTTVKCVGEESGALEIKIGRCINKEDCGFEVRNVKVFPVHPYRLMEDSGLVLLKFSPAAKDFTPICLPISEVPLYQPLDVVTLKENGQWLLEKTFAEAQMNDDCYDAMQTVMQRIVCLRDASICNDLSPLSRKLVVDVRDGRWRLEGLFNGECYGPRGNYINALYIYKFLPWIRSNVD